ncbi:radical SAM protein [Patescibacteria group bacterium]|nr:radical SAM protein [Patescibacteria group bacterium]
MKNNINKRDKDFKNIFKQSRGIEKILRLELKKIRKDSLLYINYPFCSNFCNFCIYKPCLYNQFNSDEFLKYYNKEILLYADILNGFKFKNVHIGGGTPNLVSPELLIKPLEKLVDFNNLERFIVEILPCDDFESYLEELKKYNVTKIQLGVQTLNDNILKQENRRTSRKVILDCLKTLAESDFIWSVDLMYGFRNELLYCNNRLNEFKQVLDFHPNGMHFYKLRAQQENNYYGKKIHRYSTYQKKIDLLYFEKILRKRGYQKVYDEWCLGKNIEHAKISVCYNGYSGAFPSILGLGLMAKSHLRFGLGMNFKRLRLYKFLLDANMIPMRIFHNFKKTNIYPVFNIYTGIKRLSRFNLGRFLDNNPLTKAEEKELESVFSLFKKNYINYTYDGDELKIPKAQFSKCLYLLENYMKSAYYFKK